MMSSVSLKARWHTLFPEGSLRARFATGAVWSVMGAAAAQTFTAVCGIVIARMLGVEQYGALAIVTSTIVMFSVMAELSLGITTSKHVAQFRKSDPARAGRIIALGTLVTVGIGAIIALSVAVLAEPLAREVLHESEIAPYLRLGAPLLLLIAINGVQTGTLTGFESFKAITIGRVVIAALALPLMLGGVLLAGIRGVLIAQLLLNCMSVVWFRAALARQSREWGVVISYRNAWRESFVLWSFALPALLSGVMYMPIIWAANAILVRSPNGLAEMGMFNAANQWRNLIVWIPTALSQVALPILTCLISEGDRARLGKALRLNILANFILGLAAAVPVAICSYWILSLYGPEFSTRWLALVMLSGAAVLQATINVIGQVIASISRMWWGFLLNMLWASELLFLAWYLVDFGANGLGIAHFTAYLLHLIQVTAYTAVVLRYDTRLIGSGAGSSDNVSVTPSAVESDVSAERLAL